MDASYPAAPLTVPADLTKPTAEYRRRAAAAVVGLLLFMAAYLGLCFWLGRVGYRGIRDVFAGEATIVGTAIAIPASFLFIVLIKGLFAVQRNPMKQLVEVTIEDEPELLAFIHRVADDAGAPRPHRIFLSPRVNAAVFYDVGIGNLLVPTKKNLEIGLGLVNGLSLDELKAVIAHEFGHFSQRSMGIGSWVYLSQQVVGDLITRRDALDRFLTGLSYVDIRIAWIGWIMRLLVWALRAVVDQAFRAVILLNRALGQQMEFAADRVAVSLSGSDSLVHALHRLSAADVAWGRAMGVLIDHAMRGKSVGDLFAIQTKMIERHRQVHALVGYGETPSAPPPSERPAHRVFSRELAETPRMWATHPPNHAREENCKAHYVPSKLDGRSAWVLFREPAETREALTRDLVEEIAAEGPPRDEALEALPLEEVLDGVDAEFDRPHLHRRYQGLYTFPALTRMVTEREELANERGSLEPEGLLSRLGALYPPRISQMVEQAYELDKEIDALEALKLGFLEAPGGVIVHRGRQVRRRDLPELLAALHAERGERRQQLLQGFQEARGAHLAIARRLGGGWEGYLEALLGQLLFAEHTQAEILDARAHFRNIVAHALADGNVSRSEMRQLVEAGAELAADVDGIYSLRHAVRAPTPILERMQLESFAQAFPEKRGLFAPMEADFAQDWIGAAESWVNVLASAHGALAAVTLDHLLEIEEMLARCLREGSEPEPAPPRAESPSDFPRRPHGQERPKRLELGWWDAFQLAEGRGAAALRLGVALAVLAPAFLFSADLLGGELVIYNGLERRVRVHAGETELTLGPHRSERIDVPRGPLSLRTSTMQGEPIEALDVEIAGGNRTPLYNIGGAAPLIRWRATYGTAVETPPMTLGPIRWVGEPQEDYVLEEPPRTLSLSSGQRGATRSVLEPLEEDDAQEILWGVEDPEDREQLSSIHGRWDDLESPSLGVWLLSIGDPERRAQIVRERLEERGARAGAARVRLDRILLDSLPEEARRERCDALQAEAERAPADPRLAYLRIRCEAPSDAQDEAFAALASRFESDPWAALAAGHGYAERGAWSQADALLSSRSELLEWRELQIPLLIASIRRVMAAPGQPRLGDLPSRSAALARALAIEARAPQLQQIPICQAIWAIDDGELELAARTPGLTEAELVTVRLLAGSSRGASPELVAIALEQSAPLESLGAAWASLGLRLREGRDPGPVIERIGELAGPQAASLAASFNAPVLYADPYTLDAELIRVRPQLQALAKMAAMILLGDATPEPWRAVVEGFLFEHERPRL